MSDYSLSTGPYGPVIYMPLKDLTYKTSTIRWQDQGDRVFQYIDLTSVDREKHQVCSTISIDAKTAPSRAQQIVETGDVLFGTTRPTLMRYCEISPTHDGHIASTGYAVLRTRRDICMPRFLLYCLSTREFQAFLEQNQRGSAYPAISLRELQKYRIPVPPIHIQSQIVDYLDSYTIANEELRHELRYESVALKQQAFCLCDELICEDSVPREHLYSVGSFERGKRFTTNDYVENGIPSIHYGEVYTAYGISAKETVSSVREDMHDSLRYAEPNDVIIACTGENKEDICKPVAWLGDTKVAVHDDCHIFHHSMDARYVAYALLTTEFRNQKVRAATESKVVRVSGRKLASMTIPVPSIERQREIADILDQAFSLTEQLIAELTTEIELLELEAQELRTQLLTFPEKTA